MLGDYKSEILQAWSNEEPFFVGTNPFVSVSMITDSTKIPKSFSL